ncbi:MAG TPA: dihydroorotase [Clostridiales bacterium]|nr:dihydroorotase [Clostridiales bacterium]
MSKLLLKGGRIVDPAQNIDIIADLLVEDGKIAAVAEAITADAAAEKDVSGLIVAPGLVDIHCHLREPGQERKETIATGTRAAAAGGFTTVMPMPNTSPVADNPAAIMYVKDRAKDTGVVHVYPIGAITKGSNGKELAEMSAMAEVGARAFSDDGRPVASSRMMRLAMEYSLITKLPLIAHEEDLLLVDDGDMNEGYMSTVLGLKGNPKAAEETMIARDIILARLTGARLHVAHVSTKHGAAMIREAKEEGLKITAEVTPHHLTLTEEAVKNYDTNTKVNPPLRTPEDVEALLQALKDGTIDCVATDHAPHTIEDKVIEYHFAANGISGFETALPLLYTRLVKTGKLTLNQLIDSMSAAPARIMNLPAGSLAVGCNADIVVIDPAGEKAVDCEAFYSKGKNTPFDGEVLTGWPVLTVVDGVIVMENGEIKE